MEKTHFNIKSKNYFLETEDLICREFYEYYKKNRSKPSKVIDQYNYFVKAVNGVLSLMMNMNAEIQGGLFIRDFGYFCYVKRKEKRRNPQEKSPLKKFIKRDSYSFWFYPEDGYRDWILLSNFYQETKKRNDYKFLFQEIKLYYELEQYGRKVFRESSDIKYLNIQD